MTNVTILRVPGKRGELPYRAIAGTMLSEGRTAGEALDALATQLPDAATGTMILVQYGRPDPFFTLEQQNRMAELMESWRNARDVGSELSADELTELNALIEAELEASARRAALLADASGR